MTVIISRSGRRFDSSQHGERWLVELDAFYQEERAVECVAEKLIESGELDDLHHALTVARWRLAGKGGH